PLRVTVVGRQWWWEYRYQSYGDPPRELSFHTANELHVPVCDPEAQMTRGQGTLRPTYLNLEAADVIHSYWVPRLAGKVDMLPGRTNFMWFAPKVQGLYLGQCAEYCGSQHAHMLLRVKVDSPEEFDAWLTHQQKEAEPGPGTEDGRDVFLRQACGNCHT